MRNWKRILASGIIFVILLSMLTGCSNKKIEKEQVTLNIKIPPLTVANADTDITDSYDMMVQAGNNFAEQYNDADVTVNVVKFAYTDEDDYITGCFDTENARGYFI